MLLAGIHVRDGFRVKSPRNDGYLIINIGSNHSAPHKDILEAITRLRRKI